MSGSQTEKNGGEPENRKVWQWMEAIQNGKIALPRFQRGIVWKDENISDLFTSLVKKRPVGTLLLLERQEKYEVFEPEPIMGAPDELDREKYDYLILDGQQRLTALWRALNEDFVNEKDKYKRFYLKVKKDECLYRNEGIRVEGVESVEGEEIEEDPDKLAEKCLIPVALLFKCEGDEEHITNWCIRVQPNNSKLMNKLKNNLCNLKKNFNERDISFYRLPQDVTPSEAIDTFIMINTSAQKMSELDIAIALIEQQKINNASINKLGGKSKSNSSDKFREQIKNVGIDPERVKRFFPIRKQDNGENRLLQELIVKIACLMTKSDDENVFPPSKRFYYREGVVRTVVSRWEDIVYGLDKTLGLLEKQGIFDRRRIPSEVPLRVLPALYAQMPKNIDSDLYGEVRIVLLRYLWRSFLTERYDKTADSRLRDDFVGLYDRIKRMICSQDPDKKSRPIPIFEEGVYPIPLKRQLADLKNPILKSPRSNDKRSKAMLVISLRHGAADIASGEDIDFSNISERQYHHLFPKALLEAENKTEEQINHALNFALIRSKTNAKIGAKKPKDYLSERINNRASEGEIRKRIKSHLIPYDELNVENGRSGRYKRFIEKRAECFEKAIQTLCKGERYPH